MIGKDVFFSLWLKKNELRFLEQKEDINNCVASSKLRSLLKFLANTGTWTEFLE